MFDRDLSPAQVVPVNIYGDSDRFNFKLIPYNDTVLTSVRTIDDLGTTTTLRSAMPSDPSLNATVTDFSIRSLSNEATFSLPEASEDMLLETLTATIDPGSLTPIIKEELKCTIQSRRVAQGKEKLQVRFTIPEKVELSDEEKLKVKQRREQNRIAAQKFRDKQKALGSKLSKKIQELDRRNTLMRTEVKNLKEERDELIRRLHAHMTVCPYMRFGT